MRKYLLTLLSLILVSCSSAEPLPNDVSVETTEVVIEEAPTTSTSTTTTVPVEEPYALDQFGLELVEPPTEIEEQINELMTLVEKWVGLEYLEIPKYHFYTLSNYQEYNALDYLDNFEEDYEEGEWERAVLSQNMWGLNDLSPEELLDLQVEFQRCFSAGSYNLLDKILRVPIKKNQKKLNLYEQSVVIHELVHSLQGQHFATDEWYEEMDNLDDFTYYYGFVALMEAQAEYVEGKYLLGFDTYDRQDYISQIPNIQCRVSLPSYFYIPAELYYEFGPILADQIIKNGKMEALNSALFGYINNGLNTLPTSEQIYDPARFFIDERYEELTSKTIELDNYILIDEGSFGALDLVYLMQDKIGQTNAINAAVGIGGGNWKDYEDSSGNLLMTLKLTGDNKDELQEIYEAFILWGNAQSRFSSSESYLNGSLFKGSTNFWIYNDQSFIRIVLSQDLDLLNSISNQLNEF
jgi:hypothetical protein|tara:strand:- start:1014 stop:2411 length:1398 start_codon:yes stop_codon:yes gene_type:complete